MTSLYFFLNGTQPKIKIKKWKMTSTKMENDLKKIIKKMEDKFNFFLKMEDNLNLRWKTT
jgi:hypothetical protein